MWSDPPPVCQRVVGMESNTFILLTILSGKRFFLVYFLPTTAVDRLRCFSNHLSYTEQNMYNLILSLSGTKYMR